MAVAKSRARATRGSTDGATWAAGQAFVKRGCETCRWGRRRPDGLRFVNDAMAAKRAGVAAFSLDALHLKVVETFEYPMTVGALINHYKRRCKS